MNLDCVLMGILAVMTLQLVVFWYYSWRNQVQLREVCELEKREKNVVALWEEIKKKQ